MLECPGKCAARVIADQQQLALAGDVEQSVNGCGSPGPIKEDSSCFEALSRADLIDRDSTSVGQGNLHRFHVALRRHREAALRLSSLCAAQIGSQRPCEREARGGLGPRDVKTPVRSSHRGARVSGEHLR